MSARFFDGIDWAAPWFDTVRPVAQQVLAAADWRSELNRLAQTMQLQNHVGLPLHFIAQQDLPEGVAYEAHISATGGVPTRENLHDFFNALVWLTFPLIKRQLNALQAAQIAALGIGKSRGAARDAATIFDENAAVLVLADGALGDALLAALRAHRWQEAFMAQAEVFGQAAELWSFGHALMEKLVTPYKAICAHSWVLRVDAGYFQQAPDVRLGIIDSAVAAQLAQHALTTAAYMPLPVAGIPGWVAQQDAAFYADAAVFRPAKRIECA
ncbi:MULTISPECIES: DUF3025 domain-containing protein [unclassified Undibacterium]|uniref:DUF3025 domain-containing protein n=1 Tax=unclassified Undibacterium TaxID=2630295 RepID=UPI002AC8C882|nr:MULTISPECIES: DUF3025 domain-containing protein [unclassified Undibacterium]MEB0138265.1 DUF3025 domain-containing protein [Undibacterium sp. CCC2.1]MEB0171574.1 DUF3025 domain-containing protein [Undibacterium sp. CCC1.1]MEB0175506.1 DUF3025 domain-containing protein [Undibacterium sp. CCC3.4]MEB0214774.1 DUF3025 domain-containing protein [Undibacterium sp. 5I2]WPX45261.1 DUF3025 domain-containing protein [Undibacterium sp. CCC3.4]